MDKTTSLQESQYQFPYHYLPALPPAFSSFLYWPWSLNYIATLELVKTTLTQFPFSTLIDIGCGDGRMVRQLTSTFPQAVISGIDNSLPAIRLAQALNPELSFTCLDISQAHHHLPAVDVATLIEVLEHIPPSRIPKFVSALSRLVLPQGRVLVTVPHVNQHVGAKHYQHFSLAQLTAIFHSRFQVEQVYYLSRQDWPYQLILQLLGNKLFILSHPRLQQLLYTVYRRYLFLTDSEHCSRLFVIFKRNG